MIEQTKEIASSLTLAEPNVSEADKLTLLLNTSPFGGYNIYKSLPQIKVSIADPRPEKSQTPGGCEATIRCVTLPEGTWLYQQQSAIIGHFTSLSTANELKKPSDVIYAARVKKDLKLMLFTEKENIQSMYKVMECDPKVYKDGLFAVEQVTGIGGNLMDQLMHAWTKEGESFWTTFKNINITALVLPAAYRRRRSAEQENTMLGAFCTLWKGDIHGYIATHMNTIFGLTFEQVVICRQFLDLVDTRQLDNDDVSTLIRKHSLLSASWYTSAKRYMSVHYKTILGLLTLAAAVNARRQLQFQKVQDRMETTWKELKSPSFCAKSSPSSLIQKGLFLTAFGATADFFYDAESDQVKSNVEICTMIDTYFTERDAKTTRAVAFGGILLALANIVAPTIIAQLYAATRGWSQRSSTAERLQEAESEIKEKKLPTLGKLTEEEKETLATYFGQGWKEIWLDNPSVSARQVRQHLTNSVKTSHPGDLLPALVLFDLEGHLRSKEDIFRACAVYVDFLVL